MQAEFEFDPVQWAQLQNMARVNNLTIDEVLTKIVQDRLADTAVKLITLENLKNKNGAH